MRKTPDSHHDVNWFNACAPTFVIVLLGVGLLWAQSEHHWEQRYELAMEQLAEARGEVGLLRRQTR